LSTNSLQLRKFAGDIQFLNPIDIAWACCICFPSLCYCQLYEHTC